MPHIYLVRSYLDRSHLKLVSNLCHETEWAIYFSPLQLLESQLQIAYLGGYDIFRGSVDLDQHVSVAQNA